MTDMMQKYMDMFWENMQAQQQQFIKQIEDMNQAKQQANADIAMVKLNQEQ